MKQMKEQQSQDAASMEMKEIDEALSDLEKEKSDREFEESFNRERFYMAEKLGTRLGGANDGEEEGGEEVPGEMPLRVHFRRPPKTADEAIQTLKEAD